MKRHDIARISARAFQPERKNRAKRREKYASLPRVANPRLASSYLSACKVTHVPNNFPLVISQPKFLRLLVVFDDYSRRVADCARFGDDGRSRARRRRVFCGRLRGVLRISDGKRAQRRAARGLKRKHVLSKRVGVKSVMSNVRCRKKPEPQKKVPDGKKKNLVMMEFWKVYDEKNRVVQSLSQKSKKATSRSPPLGVQSFFRGGGAV